MTDLYQAIAEVTATMPGIWIEALAKQVDVARAPSDWSAIIESAGLNGEAKALACIGTAWGEAPGLTPPAMAAALRASAATHAATVLHRTIELVWTGPATSFIPMRRTEQVVQQVIDAAKTRLLLTSYAFVNPEGIAANLKAAITRGVAVMALLEPPKSRGGAVDHDPAANLRSIVPAADILEWSQRAKARNGLIAAGCLHAKIALADSDHAFISSANFTGKAMETNMEMGVLMIGGTHPAVLRRHFDTLIEHGGFDEFP